MNPFLAPLPAVVLSLACASPLAAVACPPVLGGGGPANDFCSAVTPEPLAVGSSLTFTGDNTNATFAGDAEAGTLLAQYPSPNTWHAFITTDCADVTVSYCATDSGWSNVWKLLTTDCPAQTLINPTTVETTTCANGNWTFTFVGLGAGTYYLPVPNVGFGQGGGPYSVEVSAAACANAVPANDLCTEVVAEALAVGTSLTFTGDNTNATYAGDAEAGTLLAQYPSPNTWHAFTTAECSDVTVSYCATDSGWSNVWKLLTTDCPAQTLIMATSLDTTTCANGNWTFSFDHLEAGTYYLPVPNVGFGQGGGPYSIEVEAVACLPTGIGTGQGTTVWTVHPNPATGRSTLTIGNLGAAGVLDLLDMTGRVLMTQRVAGSNGGNVEMPLGSGLAAGQYILRYTSSDIQQAQRIVLH